jgi:hypothetical protein
VALFFKDVYTENVTINFECYVERVMTFLYGTELLLGMWFQQDWLTECDIATLKARTNLAGILFINSGNLN